MLKQIKSGKIKMETKLPSSDLFSHPDKLLEEHLINTKNIALTFLEESAINYQDFNVSKEIIKKIIKCSALCHDLGKGTDYFQRYLFAPQNEKNKLKAQEETNHSLLSSIISFYALKEDIENDLVGDEKFLFPFISFLLVKRHHGNLDYALEETRLSQKEITLLKKQLESFDEKKLNSLNKLLKIEGLLIELTKNNINKMILSIENDLRKVRRVIMKSQKENNLSFYLLINFLFSILVDSDKSEVIFDKKVERNNLNINYSVVEKYKNIMNFKRSFLNDLREKAFSEVINQPVNLENRIYSLNLPTGLGKTFASLAFALKIREKIKERTNFTPRLIYSLPFLSIIEQNGRVIENILQTNKIELNTDILLKHHYLSDLYFKSKVEEYEQAEAKILIEGWNSEIIITTFVQLFHTLFSNKNKALRKFHRIAGSVIILDEIQSIPHKYWLVIKKVLETLSIQFNVYIIFVTATDPLIFAKSETIPLVDRQKYFAGMDRIVLEPKVEEHITLEEFYQSLNIKKEKTYLFIFVYL